MYLADKTGKFIPADAASRWETIQWVFFQMASIGPMFGQLGFFNKFAGREYEDKRPLQRYVNESKRLLGVLDGRLEGRDWIMGDDYTIADIATLGWVTNLVTFYEARELVEFDRFGHVAAWLERGLARTAERRGLEIPPVGETMERCRSCSCGAGSHARFAVATPPATAGGGWGGGST